MDVSKEQIVAETKLHNTILIGSDVDKHIFAGYLADGWFRTMNRFTVYMSSEDKALGMSQRVFGKSRVGQAIANPANLTPHFVELLEANRNFMIVDVTDAQGSLDGNGHSYFRSSPWVSSDVLMNIFYNLAPEERGLVRDPDYPIWSFPPDYIERLRAALQKKGVTVSQTAE
jgi:esterase/lipase superfamily enzyme